MTLYEEALDHLREGVNRYNGLIRQGRQELQPKLIHAQLTLGGVLSDQGSHTEAVAALNEPVRAVQTLVDADRVELEPMLGLALLNRGLAYLRRGSPDEALMDSDAALETFERLVRRRADVAGWYALAILNRSEVRCQLGDREGAAEDRRRGFALARKLVTEGHTNIRLLIMRKTFSAAVYDPCVENFTRLRETLLEVEEFIQAGRASEHMLIALRVALGRLEEVSAELDRANFDQELLARLQKSASAK